MSWRYFPCIMNYPLCMGTRWNSRSALGEERQQEIASMPAWRISDVERGRNTLLWQLSVKSTHAWTRNGFVRGKHFVVCDVSQSRNWRTTRNWRQGTMRSQNSLCWMQETLMLVCPSDACVCAIHEHHEEARAALMRVASMRDWTKQTDPRRCTILPDSQA